MANKHSDVFANFYTTPRTLNPALAVRGAVFFSRATVQLVNADPAGVIVPMLRFPAQARILAIWLANDALASVTDLNIGLYTAVDWSAGDGTIKGTGDQYADGISLATARTQAVSVDPALASRAASDAVHDVGSMANVWGSGANALTGIQWARQIWEDAGDATAPRPGTEYDLCLTVVSDPAGTGNIVLGVQWVFGS